MQHFDVEHWKLVLYLCTREDRAVKPKFWPGIWTFQSRPDFCPKFWREFWKMSFFANSQYWTIKSTLTFDHSVNFCNLANDWNFVWKFCAQSWSEFCLDLDYFLIIIFSISLSKKHKLQIMSFLIIYQKTSFRRLHFIFRVDTIVLNKQKLIFLTTNASFHSCFHHYITF